MDTDSRIKASIYHSFATTARAPSVQQLARQHELLPEEIIAAMQRLFAARVLVLKPDGASIRMAPPFSAVPTQHSVKVDGRDYYANCAWDALGIPAALHKAGTVFSRCELSGDPLRLEVEPTRPPDSDWLFHCAVPAARWWQDIVFT
jgi:hypothetical protein